MTNLPPRLLLGRSVNVIKLKKYVAKNLVAIQKCTTTSNTIFHLKNKMSNIQLLIDISSYLSDILMKSTAISMTLPADNILELYSVLV